MNNGMRKLIWGSSVCAFVPVLAGLGTMHLWGGRGGWSLAAGGAFAAVAFGSFLEIANSATTLKGLKGFLPVAVPVAALLVVGCLGAMSMDLLSRDILRPETFVSGILAGTLFSQFALLVVSQRLRAIRN